MVIITIRTRGIMTWDVREQTEYGTLRGYIAGGWQTSSGNAQTQYAAPSTYYAPRAFIQFAGFTLGKATSFYGIMATPLYSNTTNVWGADTGGSGKIVWGYTAQFGNGLSASIALEDPAYAQNTGFTNTSYVGNPQIPDLVANMNLDATWGQAMIMGALHQLNAQGTVATNVYPDDKVGWAVGGGIKLKLDMISPGDHATVEASYSEGAINYVGSGIGNFSWCHDHSANCGIGIASDATWTGSGNGSLSLTTAWDIVAGYSHTWNPNWKTSVYATYGEVSYPNDAVLTTSKAGNWNYSQISSRTVWNPVKNLDLSLEVMYQNLGTAQVTGCPCTAVTSPAMTRAPGRASCARSITSIPDRIVVS